ncbi:hypothetical protein OCU04_003359 [Sclerotinia nivalis]|uniref:Uncharacterized protein n=1 Tax=Sclerotinia nivalis TaxID=352851 RepID=A0A9X0DMM1_9HELO|nr:hypothetical protein OCU04_003359 [Sclerotinia nivalis]
MEPKSNLESKNKVLGYPPKYISPKREPNANLRSTIQPSHKLTMLVANHEGEKRNRVLWEALEEQLEKIETMAGELKTACRMMLDEEID